MEQLLTLIISLIMSLTVSGGVSNAAEVPPEEAAKAFLDGIKAYDEQVVDSYMDNKYVNFLENADGEPKDTKKMQEAILGGMEYEILDSIQKNRTAVVKVRVSNKDFSNVMPAYEKASYDYVMEHLYDENISDKDYLNDKCVSIYVKQLEKTASKGKTVEKEIFIPMEDDGYYGWRIVLDDGIMKSLMGNFKLPVK